MKTENTQEQIEKIELYNLFKVAFCKHRGKNNGVKIIPKMGENRRVLFEITGEGVCDLINEFYTNPLIRLNDYLKHLSHIRALIIATKDLNTSCDDREGFGND